MDFVSSFSMMYCSISHIKEQSSLKSQKYLQKTEKSHKRTEFKEELEAVVSHAVVVGLEVVEGPE